MKIISYNVNGIRAAAKKGLKEWLSDEDPDIFCIQESKASLEQIEGVNLHDLGYHLHAHSAVKKGYSGVATFSKQEPTKVTYGMGNDKYDHEGRVLITSYDQFTLLNCYFPSGSSGDERHVFKMEFLNDFLPFLKQQIKESKEVILVGDYNIVHLDIDIHNPTRKDLPSGFRPEERAWLDQLFTTDMKDSYRVLNAEVEDVYSWWSYRAGSRGKNKGWRIDYAGITNGLVGRLKTSKYLSEAVHSDHCPISIELDL